MRVTRCAAVVSGLLFALMVADSSSAAEKRELHLGGFTGKMEEVFRRVVLDDFEKTFDCKIFWTAGLSMHHVAKLEAQRNSPTLDLVMIDEIPQSIARKKGLLAPLEDTTVPNLKNVYDFARLPGDVGVGFGLISFGIVYNEKIFKEKGWVPPTSWHDIFRPELKGKVVATAPTSTPGLNTLLVLSFFNGGSEKQIDRGFEMMVRLAPNVVAFVNTAGEQTALFQQGAAWVGAWFDQDMYTVVKSTGLPLVFVRPKEGTTGQTMTINLVRGAKNPELARQLIDHLLSEKVQALMAREVGLGPVNKRVTLAPDVAAQLLYGEEEVKKLFPVDIDYVNEHRSAWVERFNREVATRR